MSDIPSRISHASPSRRGGLWLPSWPAVALAGLTTVLLVLGVASPRPGHAVVAVFPGPMAGAEAMARVVAAGLLPVRAVDLRAVGGVPLVGVLARPVGQAMPVTPPGAWLVLDADGLKGCGG